MTDAREHADEPIDVRLLSRQDLKHEAFPGGCNEGLRVFFTTEVHKSLWRHAALDTSVEICGVLVGSWHRDQAGPFVKIVESIRGEGAQTRFAEVTFTHETWAKINSEMDTKFSNLSIVGWYHTHPDFGIFLSDRDRFIHEHFFTGPGQIAHVIDPIRKTEGVFIWRNATPSLCEHYWVGDRILAQSEGGSDRSAALEPGPPSHTFAETRRQPGSAQSPPAAGARKRLGHSVPSFGPLIAHALAFFVGYLLANLLSAWEHQRFVESVLASNGFVAVLRLGLADELDGLRGDLAAMLRPLEVLGSNSGKPEEQLAELRAQLVTAARRAAAIKAQYANTSAEDDLLKRMLRDRLASKQPNRSPELSGPGAPQLKEPATKADSGASGKPSPPEPSLIKPSDGDPSDCSMNVATDV
jgi:proteasome lid subunit RPN8/RPN11